MVEENARVSTPSLGSSADVSSHQTSEDGTAGADGDAVIAVVDTWHALGAHSSSLQRASANEAVSPMVDLSFPPMRQHVTMQVDSGHERTQGGGVPEDDGSQGDVLIKGKALRDANESAPSITNQIPQNVSPGGDVNVRSAFSNYTLYASPGALASRIAEEAAIRQNEPSEATGVPRYSATTEVSQSPNSSMASAPHINGLIISADLAEEAENSGLVARLPSPDGAAPLPPPTLSRTREAAACTTPRMVLAVPQRSGHVEVAAGNGHDNSTDVAGGEEEAGVDTGEVQTDLRRDDNDSNNVHTPEHRPSNRLRSPIDARASNSLPVADYVGEKVAAATIDGKEALRSCDKIVAANHEAVSSVLSAPIRHCSNREGVNVRDANRFGHAHEEQVGYDKGETGPSRNSDFRAIDEVEDVAHNEEEDALEGENGTALLPFTLGMDVKAVGAYAVDAAVNTDIRGEAIVYADRARDELVELRIRFAYLRRRCAGLEARLETEGTVLLAAARRRDAQLEAATASFEESLAAVIASRDAIAARVVNVRDKEVLRLMVRAWRNLVAASQVQATAKASTPTLAMEAPPRPPLALPQRNSRRDLYRMSYEALIDSVLEWQEVAGRLAAVHEADRGNF